MSVLPRWPGLLHNYTFPRQRHRAPKRWPGRAASTTTARESEHFVQAQLAAAVTVTRSPEKRACRSLRDPTKERRRWERSTLCSVSLDPGTRSGDQAVLREQGKEGSALLSCNHRSWVFSSTRRLKLNCFKDALFSLTDFPDLGCAYSAAMSLRAPTTTFLVNSSVKFVSLFFINNPPTNVSQCQS